MVKQSDEVKTIMSLGASKIYSIDPQHQQTIQKRTMDQLVMDAKKHLSQKRKVHFVLVKE